jgi:hypothetical protein
MGERGWVDEWINGWMKDASVLVYACWGDIARGGDKRRMKDEWIEGPSPNPLIH